jgi:hypothetical protein
MVDYDLGDRVVSLRMATSVRMTYAEAIAFDRNLRPIVKMYGAPGFAFQRASLSWFRR